MKTEEDLDDEESKVPLDIERDDVKSEDGDCADEKKVDIKGIYNFSNEVDCSFEGLFHKHDDEIKDEDQMFDKIIDHAYDQIDKPDLYSVKKDKRSEEPAEAFDFTSSRGHFQSMKEENEEESEAIEVDEEKYSNTKEFRRESTQHIKNEYSDNEAIARHSNGLDNDRESNGESIDETEEEEDEHSSDDLDDENYTPGNEDDNDDGFDDSEDSMCYCKFIFWSVQDSLLYIASVHQMLKGVCAVSNNLWAGLSWL